MIIARPAFARMIIRIITAPSCSIPTATTLRRCATRRNDGSIISRRGTSPHPRRYRSMPIEPPEIPPAIPGPPTDPPQEAPPGNPQPEIPAPVREPGESPRPEELPGQTPEELPVRGPQGPSTPATDITPQGAI